MSTSIAVRGVSYTLPTSGDVDYATLELAFYSALAAAAYDALESVHAVGDSGEPAFENSWVNRGSGESGASFYKDPFGVVHIFGAVTDGSPGTIFTLPTGYRPPGILKTAAVTSGGTGGIVKINPDGTVVAQTATTFLYLDGITFRV